MDVREPSQLVGVLDAFSKWVDCRDKYGGNRKVEKGGGGEQANSDKSYWWVAVRDRGLVIHDRDNSKKE